ncbi:MAG: hypothetical protein ACREGA_04120, partial [Candidatus Saccharimonadales bacterium]
MKHKIFALASVALIIFSAVISLIPAPQKAKAAPANNVSLKFTSFSTVQLNATIHANITTPNSSPPTRMPVTFSFKNVTFTDGAPWDANNEYEHTNSCGKSTIQFSNNDLTNAKLKLYAKTASIGCPYVGYTAKATNLSASYPVFDWTSPTTITATNSADLGSNAVLTKTSGGSFVNTNIKKDLVNRGGSDSRILGIGGLGSLKSCTISVTPKNSGGNSGTANATCKYSELIGNQSAGTYVHAVINGSPNNPVTAGIGSNGGSGSAGGSGSGSNGSSSAAVGAVAKCQGTASDPLSWFMCPIINQMQHIMSYVGSVITQYLTIPGRYFNKSTAAGAAVYQAWSSVRDLALALLVIFALIMIISQALSIGSIDAYTVKKLLPRILVAIILVTLSWPLLQLMIAVSNGIGEGTRALIYAPFKNLPGVDISVNGTTSISLIGGLGAGAAFGLLGSLSFGLTAILALLTGLAIIILRQMLVIFLAIFAPIALVLYALPGTENGYKLWWDSFFGALLLFPIIEGMLAMGSAFAQIVSNGSTGNIIDEMIAFFAIYIPYFLLPLTVRFAGGALRNIGGTVHAGARGGHGALQNFRKGQATQRLERAKSGTLYGPKNVVGRKLSSVAQTATTAPEWMKGAPRNWSGGIRNIKRAGEVARGNELAEKDPMLARANGDTGLLAAGMDYDNHHSTRKLRKQLLDSKYGGDESKLNKKQKQSLNDDQALVEDMYKNHNTAAHEAFYAMRRSDANGWKAKTTAEGKPVSHSVTQQAYQSAIDSSGGDINKGIQNAMAVRSGQGRAGRGDVGDASSGMVADTIREAMTSGGGKISDEAAKKLILDGVMGKNAVDQTRQHRRSMESKVPEVTTRITEITKNGKLSPAEVRQNSSDEGAELDRLLDTMKEFGGGMGANYASAQVRQIINNTSTT